MLLIKKKLKKTVNNNKLYVGNLSFETTQDELKAFSDFGEIKISN